MIRSFALSKYFTIPSLRLQTIRPIHLRNTFTFCDLKPQAKQKEGHWHILKTQSFVKDLEIIYYQQSKDINDSLSRVTLIESLISSKNEIINKIEQFKCLLAQNKAELDSMVESIKLNTSIIIGSLDNIIEELQKYCERPNDMSIHELHAKQNTLSFTLRQIFINKKQQNLFKKLAYIIEVQIRLRSAFNYINQYQTQPNITNSHPSLFSHVWKHIQIEVFQNQNQIHQVYSNLENTIHATIGAIQKSQSYNNNLLEKLALGFYLPRNIIKYQWGLLNSLSIYRSTNLQSYRKFLNLYEDGLIKHITSQSFGKITTNLMIYIPPTGQFPDDLDIFKENDQYIPVRILYHQDLPLLTTHQNANYIEDIIIHMHGGGFIGLSSQTTQNYTRPWANALKMPLFSIDYRLAPKYPYPHASNDCFQVYKFIINRIDRYMKIRPKNIYVCGDSAGGNLSCALTALIMKNNLLKPVGIFLAYPCLDLRTLYYPSRKFLISDPLVWPSIAQLFFNSYVSQEQKVDPIATPMLLTEQLVGGCVGDKRFPLSWPMTYITIGSKDSLRDESLLLMQKMVQSNIQCKCIIFEHLRHAFFSTQKLMKQSNQAFNHSIDAFKQLVQRTKKQQL